MFKKIFTIIILMSIIAAAAYSLQFYQAYFVIGKIVDSADGKAKAAGQKVILYRNETEKNNNLYSMAAVGQDGNYVLTPSFNPLLGFLAGERFKVAVVRDSNDYGSGPSDFTVSGKGYDEIPVIAMAHMKGTEKPPGPPIDQLKGEPPKFEWIKFGDRYYQKEMVAKGTPFVVSEMPKISAKVVSDFGINVNSLAIAVNEKGGPTPPYKYNIDASDIISKALAKNNIALQAISFTSKIPEDKKLKDGVNTLTFYAANQAGQTAEAASVTVVVGPVKVIGPVIVFPSPFAPSKDKDATIQYVLSADANIDLFVFSPIGEIVKKSSFISGQNGGAAGVNKVLWNGKKPSGSVASNGVYSGAIVSKDDGRILMKFKLTIADLF